MHRMQEKCFHVRMTFQIHVHEKVSSFHVHCKYVVNNECNGGNFYESRFINSFAKKVTETLSKQ